MRLNFSKTSSPKRVLQEAQALTLLPERIAGSDGKIIGTVHDEIILEAPDDNANELAKILQNTMIEAGSMYLKRVPVDAEVKIADSWAQK